MGPSGRFTHAMDYIGYGIYVVSIIVGAQEVIFTQYSCV